MDPAFFRSRQFLVAGFVALLLVVGGVAAFASPSLHGSFTGHGTSGCVVEMPPGSVLAAPVESTGVGEQGEGWRRVVTTSIDASELDAGVVRACADVGRLTVRPSEDGRAHVVATVQGKDRAAVEGAPVEIRFLRTGGGLGIAAWHGPQNVSRSMWGDEATSVSFEIRLPDVGAWDVGLRGDVGAVRIEGVQTSELDARSDVGRIDISDLHARGDVRVRTDVGRATVALASVETGTVDVRTDVGTINITLPARTDVGYHVVARSDVGSLNIDVGPAESTTTDRDGAGGRTEVQTRDYESKPTKVRVVATSDVGDIFVNTH